MSRRRAWVLYVVFSEFAPLDHAFVSGTFGSLGAAMARGREELSPAMVECWVEHRRTGARSYLRLPAVVLVTGGDR